MMGPRCYVLLRRPYVVPIRRRGDAPLRRLGDVLLRESLTRTLIALKLIKIL